MKSIAITALLCALASSARADETIIKSAPPKWKNHFLTYGSFGFNAYTYLPATGSAPDSGKGPSNASSICSNVARGHTGRSRSPARKPCASSSARDNTRPASSMA